MTSIDAKTQELITEVGNRLVVYNDPSAFELLRADWQSLESRDSRCGVFQSHTWLSHIWAFESGPRTQMLMVGVHGPGGRLDALAPLVIEKRLGPIGVRVLRFMGRNFSDYQDILFADDCDRDAVISLLAGWLRERMGRLDMIEFLKIQEGAHLWEHREALLPTGLERCEYEAETYDQSRYFQIEGGFDDYLMRLSKPTRKNCRRYWSRLNEAYQVELSTITRGDQADTAFYDLVRLHQQRQVRRGQRGMFRTPQRVGVFTGLFKMMLEEGTLRLHLMKIDGRVYNVELIFYYKQTAIAYNGGMDDDPAVARHSPGFLAMIKIIELAHTDSQIRYFDLGQGDEPYKSHIAKQVRPLHRVCCVRNRLRGKLDRGYHFVQAWAHQNPIVQRVYFCIRPNHKKPIE